MDASPLYQQLAQRLCAAMDSGVLARGSRLPSVRQLAQQEGVSQATVVQAYRWLEDAQRVQARPRSGYFVRPTVLQLPEPRPSLPDPMARRIQLDRLGRQVMHASREPGVISFGAACPGPELFDMERARRTLTRVVQRQRHLLGHYPLGPGQMQVRQAVARHAMSLGCMLQPDDIVMTNGCLDAITLALRSVTRPGDVVAIESPTYFGFLELLQSLHLRALSIPTHPRSGLSVEALELALHTQPVRAVVLTPTLSNPLGCCMPQAARRRLAQLASAHDVAVVEDVIYNDLCELDEQRRAIKAYDTSGHVLMCGSFSKTLAPGLRLGYVAAGRWCATLQRHKEVQSGGQTPVLELALAELLQQNGLLAQQRQLRAALCTRLAQARELVALSFPPGTRVSNPAGGFILWVEMPQGVDSAVLFEHCLAENICIAPGLMFSTDERYRHCLRLGVGGAWGPAQLQALRRMGALAQALWAAQQRSAAAA
ncbi:PLP-dependent aminotransferase family protein [Roseateles sp. BYS180W]|uniref:PLP-dependent aminotransferase family protein n=1 Tax=Roseateles rivi TaxID=3299028 RepID=A0ABW7FQQ9_9BURK